MSEEQFTLIACIALAQAILTATSKSKEPWEQGLSKLKPSNIRKKKKEP